MPQTATHPVHALLFRATHTRSVRLLRDGFAITSSTRMLDLGGRLPLWLGARDLARIRLLTWHPTGQHSDREGGDDVTLNRDGTLSCPDRAYDVLFCDGLLAGTPDAAFRTTMAAEMARVARGLFVRVSARTISPSELHRLFPDCEIHVERVAGLPRASIALRRTEPLRNRLPASSAAAVSTSASPA